MPLRGVLGLVLPEGVGLRLRVSGPRLGARRCLGDALRERMVPDAQSPRRCIALLVEPALVGRDRHVRRVVAIAPETRARLVAHREHHAQRGARPLAGLRRLAIRRGRAVDDVDGHAELPRLLLAREWTALPLGAPLVCSVHLAALVLGVLEERAVAFLGVGLLARRVAGLELREERIGHVVRLLLVALAAVRRGRLRGRLGRGLGLPGLQPLGERALLHSVEVRTDYRRSTTIAEAPPPPWGESCTYVAHARDAVLALLQRMHERHDDTRAGAADRVAQRDAAAERVHLARVQAEDLHVRERHHGERLVDLEARDLLLREACALERTGNRERGRDGEVDRRTGRVGRRCVSRSAYR